MNLWYSFLLACLVQLTSATLFKTEPPSGDPFYKVPANISGYQLGDVISWRPAPSKIRALFYPINTKNAWQFLVRSTDGTGNATAIVTTVIEPYDADPRKVLSYQFAEDSSNPDCAPSYSILFGASADSITIQVEAYLMNPALSKGWYVVAPDYEGPQAAFTVGKQGGRATLDSIKAILASEEITGIKSDAQVAMWGYSGGTIATGWAAQLQPDYAPELKDNLIGAAVGGWCTNLTATVEACDGTIFAGLIANGINGILNQYPWVKQHVYNKIGSKIGQLRFSAANSECLAGSILKYPLTKFFGGWLPWFEGGWNFFSDEAIIPLLRESTLAYEQGDGVPEIPLFVYHGEVDEIIPIVGAERGYKNYCEWGIQSMEFAASKTTGHILEAVEGAGAALRWLEDRFNGKSPVQGCQRTDRETNLDYPGADLAFYKLFKSAIDGLLQGKLGEGYNEGETIPAPVKAIVAAISKLLGTLGPIPFKRGLDGEQKYDYEQLAAMMITSKNM